MFFGHIAVAACQTFINQPVEIGFFGLPFRNREFWNAYVAKFKFDGTAIGYFSSVGYYLWVVCSPSGYKLLWWYNVQLKIFETHALFIAQKCSGTNAQQNLMRILIFMFQVVRITCQDNWNTQFCTELENAIIDTLLFMAVTRSIWMSVILNFEVVPIAEDPLVPCRDIFCRIIIIVFQCISNLTTHTCTRCD